MAPRKQPGRLPAGLRVLLVEDEFMVALLLETDLTEIGCEIIGPIGRVDRALEIARREAVDVAILDININGNEVYPVAEALAARGIPFVFVSGYGRRGLRAPWGDRPTLQKPFRIGDLVALIEATCVAKRN
jgi:DNA-binding response OmpR family regulator